MKHDPFKLRTPFFRSASRRFLVTGACLAWALLELFLGNQVWFAVFAVLGLYLAFVFFIHFDPADYEERDDEEPS